ncbi:MAG: maleate cis-trans isomerase family protein [Hyphomicrobiaceae bacterium]
MSKVDVVYELEDIAPDGRIGLIALATDYNSEADLRRMLPAGVDMFTNRVLNANPVTLENLRAMSGDITRAAQGILPGHGVDVMIYGCTSGTAAIGEDEVAVRIRAAQPGVPCTNPIAAARAGLHAFQSRRISILTPYTAPVNAALADRFSEQGFDVLNIDGFGMDDDIEMTGLPLPAIAEAAIQVCAPDADALFISCTAIRAAAIVETLEEQLAKPVITSNQALVWHALRLIDNPARVRGFGRLFELPMVDGA